MKKYQKSEKMKISKIQTIFLTAKNKNMNKLGNLKGL